MRIKEFILCGLIGTRSWRHTLGDAQNQSLAVAKKFVFEDAGQGLETFAPPTPLEKFAPPPPKVNGQKISSYLCVHALFRQKHNSFRSLPTSVTHWCQGVVKLIHV